LVDTLVCMVRRSCLNGRFFAIKLGLPENHGAAAGLKGVISKCGPKDLSLEMVFWQRGRPNSS
jgi:hypothetical protein